MDTLFFILGTTIPICLFLAHDLISDWIDKKK